MKICSERHQRTIRDNALRVVIGRVVIGAVLLVAQLVVAPHRALAADVSADKTADKTTTADAPLQLAQSTSRTPRTNTTLDNVVVEGQRERSTVALDGVATTGSRLNLETRDLPASISVVSQDVIQMHGARTAVEAINTAVGMTGGISVGSIPSFSTRGFTSNDITVMRDGIRQNTGSQSSRQLDSFLFDRIEVLKGPASLLYGEGAIGGAINYVSKLPTEMYKGEAYVSAGSWEALRYGAGVGGPTGIDDLYFRIDASRSTSEGYVDNSDSEYSAFAGSLRWDISDDTALTFSGTYLKDATNSYYGTPVVYDEVINQFGVHEVRLANTTTDQLVNARIEPGTERNNYNILDNFARAENSFWRLILESKLGGNWSLRNEAYAATQRFTWRNVESTVWNPAPTSQLVERSSFFLIYRNDNQIGDRLDLVWDGTIAGRPNKFLVGVVYDYNDQVRNSGQTYPGIPTPAKVPLFNFDPGYGPDAVTVPTYDLITETTAGYIENMYQPIDALKIIAGLRYDYIDVEKNSYLGAPVFTKSYNPFTGRLGVVYEFTSEINAYASYSKAAQPVSQIVSLSSTQADFSLQKGRQYEVGMKASMFADQAELTVALFDIEKNDLLTSTDVIGVGRVPSQIGAQVSQGTEIALALSLAHDWRIDANYAYTWKAEFEDFNENNGSGVISRSGNTPANVPKVVAGLFVTKMLGPWSISGDVRHVGERQANNNNGIQMDAYTTLSASIGYNWENVSVTLRGRNLTDEVYSEWANGGGLIQRLAEPTSGEVDFRVKF